jgi:ribosomal protein L37E
VTTCSHCGRHEAAPDRKLCAQCLATKARARKRANSPAGLKKQVKALAKYGRGILKDHQDKVIIEMTPGELDLLLKYKERGKR